MKQKVIRLTENDLHNIIKESVNMILKENFKQDEIDASWDQHLLNENVHLYQKIFKNKQTF